MHMNVLTTLKNNVPPGVTAAEWFELIELLLPIILEILRRRREGKDMSNGTVIIDEV